MTHLRRCFLTSAVLLALLWGTCPARPINDNQRRTPRRATRARESARIQTLLREQFMINLPRSTRVEVLSRDEGSGVQYLCASMSPRDAARLKVALAAGPKSERRRLYVVERGDETPVGSLPYAGSVPDSVEAWRETHQFGNGETVVVIENVFRRGLNELGTESYAVLRMAESRGLVWLYFAPRRV